MARIKPARWLPGRNEEGIAGELWRGCQLCVPLWHRNLQEDLSPERRAVTLTGSPTWANSTRGLVLDCGTSIDLWGVSIEPNPCTFPMTWLIWVYLRTVDGNRHLIWSTSLDEGDGWGGGDETHITAGRVAQQWGYYCQTNGTIHVKQEGVGVATTGWHQVGLVIDTTFRLYVDGIEVDSVVSNGTPDFSAYSGHPFCLGFYNPGSGQKDRALDGCILQAIILDYALSARSFAQLYADPFCMIEPPAWHWGFSAGAGAGGGLSIPIAMRHYRNLRVA